MTDTPRPSAPVPPSPGRAARRTVIACAGIAGLMLGAAFAAVPLYDLFCRVTGFGGTPQVARSAPAKAGDRVVAVRFDANVAPALSWRFEAETPVVQARVGETMTVFYRITNTGKAPSTGIASFNVVPELTGGYFNKIQCFCFNEITLQPGESMEAPVVFFVDPAIAENRDLRTTSTITLSYTFFPAKGSPRPLAEAKDGGTPKL